MKTSNKKSVWFKRTCGSVALAAGAALLATASPAWADPCRENNPGVIPPQAKPHGKSYGEWGGAWWNWALQFPYLSDPITDDTGEDGDQGQQGPVWFLAGTYGSSVDRTLTVPVGKALFFPLFNSLMFFPLDVPTEPEARALANGQADSVDILECSVDGRQLKDLSQYRAESPSGGYTQALPEGSIQTDPDFWLAFGYDFAYPPGETGAVTDGYWIMLSPLSVGEHLIHFRSGITGWFETEVTYHITVVPRKP